MDNIKPYTDFETIPTHWRAKSIKVFINAVAHYKSLLKPYDNPNNELIQKEMHKLDVLLKAFNEHLSKTEGDYDTRSMNFDGDYLKTLYSILWQYKLLKEDELAKEDADIHVRGALEYKQKEVNELAELLALPIWQRVERRPLLVDTFLLSASKKEFISEGKQDNSAQEENKFSQYIKQEIIDGFVNKQDGYNYKKLIKLLNELNDNFKNRNTYSSSMLIRAILDHVPPLLGVYTFNEIVSNYPWPETDRKYMSSLLDFKNEGDDALHRTISADPDLLDMEDLPMPIRINRLLQECIVNGGQTLLPRKKTKETSPNASTNSKNINVSLLEEDVKWANWGMRNLVWSSFQVKLKVDNYKSKLPDYVSVEIEAELNSGETWKGTHFIFQGVDKQDEELRIEEYEQKNVVVFISNERATNDRVEMPEFKKNTIKLIINTKSGNNFKIPIKDQWVTKG